MSIIEQIKALPKDMAVWHGFEEGVNRFASTDDLIALAESHERLLKIAKVMAATPDYVDAAHAVAHGLQVDRELDAAIEEAENLTRTWTCGRCEQEAKGIPVTIPEHFRTCPKRNN